MNWTDLTLRVLERALDASSFRHKLLANNIANADTPGYKRKDLVFKEELERLMLEEAGKEVVERSNGDSTGISSELVTTHPDHLGKSREDFNPRITGSDNQSWRKDENNVDVEREMVELAKNDLYYQVVADQLNRQLQRIEKVISNAGQK